MKEKSLLHGAAAVLGVLLALIVLCSAVLASSEAATAEPAIRSSAVQSSSEESSEEPSEDSAQALLYVNGTASAAEVFDGVLYADVAAFCAALHLCSISADYAFVHVYDDDTDLFAWVGDDTLSFGGQSIAADGGIREIDGAPAVSVSLLVHLFGLESDGGEDGPVYVSAVQSVVV